MQAAVIEEILEIKNSLSIAASLVCVTISISHQFTVGSITNSISQLLLANTASFG